MPLPRSEQETTITWLNSDKIAYLWTSNPAVMRKWVKRGYTLTLAASQEGEAIAWSCKVESRCIRFGSMARRKARPDAAKALAAARAARRSQ